MSLPFIPLSIEAIKAIESIKLYTSERLPPQLIHEKKDTKACYGCYLYAAAILSFEAYSHILY